MYLSVGAKGVNVFSVQEDGNLTFVTNIGPLYPPAEGYATNVLQAKTNKEGTKLYILDYSRGLFIYDIESASIYVSTLNCLDVFFLIRNKINFILNSSWQRGLISMRIRSSQLHIHRLSKITHWRCLLTSILEPITLINYTLRTCKYLMCMCMITGLY